MSGFSTLCAIPILGMSVLPIDSALSHPWIAPNIPGPSHPHLQGRSIGRLFTAKPRRLGSWCPVDEETKKWEEPVGRRLKIIPGRRRGTSTSRRFHQFGWLWAASVAAHFCPKTFSPKWKGSWWGWGPLAQRSGSVRKTLEGCMMFYDMLFGR